MKCAALTSIAPEILRDLARRGAVLYREAADEYALLPLVVGMYEFQRIGSDGNLSKGHTDLQLDVSRHETPPDIYYIVLDRYANASTLAEV